MSADRFTEILNYLSAMSREIGEFRAETKSRLDQIEVRLDKFEARFGSMERRIDHLETEIRSKFDDLGSDIRRLHHKFELVQEDSTELRLEQRDQRKRIEALERKQA